MRSESDKCPKESLESGIGEQSWMVGSGVYWPEWDEAGERMMFRAEGDEQREKQLIGMRRRERRAQRKGQFEV